MNSAKEIYDLFLAIDSLSKRKYNSDNPTKLSNKDQAQLLVDLGCILKSEADELEKIWNAQDKWRKENGF